MKTETKIFFGQMIVSDVRSTLQMQMFDFETSS